MIARLERDSSIVSASVSSVLPLQPNDTVGFSMISGPLLTEDRRPKVFKTSVTADYFATFAIPITRGRGIERDDHGERPWIAVINESMSNRYWRGNALGRLIQLNSDVQPRTIVGIVRDTVQNSVGEQPIAQVYVPYEQETQWVSYTTLAIRTRIDPRVMEPSVERIVRSLDPMVGVSHASTMEEVLSENIAAPRFRTLLLDALALLALTLAVIGLYGIVAYGVGQRTREIGIRIAIGAETSHILRLVLGEAMLLTFLGALLGLIGSTVLARTLRALVFGIEATDPGTLLIATLGVAAAALVASWIPARRALKVDPAISLRYE